MHALRVVWLSLAMVVALAGGAGCAGFAAKGAAETGVANFHEMLDAERYSEIYDATDELFKNATAGPRFVELLQGVHRKLGAVRSTTLKGYVSRDQTGTNAGSYLSMNYETEFAEGPATEAFNWKVVNGKVYLAGYNIQSALFITR
jgi:hypothetical protein